MRKKLIIGTLVVATLLLGTIIPLISADDLCPDQQYYWIKHNDESVDPMNPDFKRQYWDWEVNAYQWDNHKGTGLMEEIWYTDSMSNGLYPGTIRPIRVEGWKQNTWISGEATTDGADATLHVVIYATPANEYPELLNWTVRGGNVQDGYWRIRAYDWDDSSELCNFTIDIGTSGVQKDKLGSYQDQFRMELDWYRY